MNNTTHTRIRTNTLDGVKFVVRRNTRTQDASDTGNGIVNFQVGPTRFTAWKLDEPRVPAWKVTRDDSADPEQVSGIAYGWTLEEAKAATRDFLNRKPQGAGRTFSALGVDGLTEDEAAELAALVRPGRTS